MSRRVKQGVYTTNGLLYKCLTFRHSEYHSIHYIQTKAYIGLCLEAFYQGRQLLSNQLRKELPKERVFLKINNLSDLLIFCEQYGSPNITRAIYHIGLHPETMILIPIQPIILSITQPIHYIQYNAWKGASSSPSIGENAREGGKHKQVSVIYWGVNYQNQINIVNKGISQRTRLIVLTQYANVRC